MIVDEAKFKTQGLLYGLAAYVSWGVLPIYWKLFAKIPLWEIVAHRFVWALLFYFSLIFYKKRFQSFVAIVKNKKLLALLLLSGFLIGCNWSIFIYAVNSNHVIQSSLGYFMNPLVNLLLGTLFLKEKLRKFQWVAVFIAAMGVLSFAFQSDGFPWLSLGLAFSFGFYGILHKIVPVEALESSTIETILLFPVAVVILIFKQWTETSLLPSLGVTLSLVMVLGGVATGLPLLFFTEAVRKLPYSLIGFLQYIAPTLAMFIALFVYHEPFSKSKLITFCFIWVGLIIFSLEGICAMRSAKEHVKQKSLRVSNSSS